MTQKDTKRLQEFEVTVTCRERIIGRDREDAIHNFIEYCQKHRQSCVIKDVKHLGDAW